MGMESVFIISKVLSGCYVKGIRRAAPEAKRKLLQRNHQSHFFSQCKENFKKIKVAQKLSSFSREVLLVNNQAKMGKPLGVDDAIMVLAVDRRLEYTLTAFYRASKIL